MVVLVLILRLKTRQTDFQESMSLSFCHNIHSCVEANLAEGVYF